jgi:hypothetical protein
MNEVATLSEVLTSVQFLTAGWLRWEDVQRELCSDLSNPLVEVMGSQ